MLLFKFSEINVERIVETDPTFVRLSKLRCDRNIGTFFRLNGELEQTESGLPSFRKMASTVPVFAGSTLNTEIRSLEPRTL